jgi:branched-chain amino acid aminotransferase
MVNLNGNLIEKETCSLSLNNRGYKYGDSLFETIRVNDGKIIFLEDHYFRLMASMRMIRMEIPMNFSLDYLEEQIQSLITILDNDSISKVRITVSRKEGGLYLPTNNDIDFIIEVFEGNSNKKESYTVDLFKDHYVNSGMLSTIKSSNRLLNVVASIFAEENDLDNCILVNEQKNVVEATNSNIFIVKGNIIKTPALLDGCIKGIARKKIIEILEKNKEYTLEETQVSPFELQKADEIFLTNAIAGVQSVTNYRKKKFETNVGQFFAAELKKLSEV